MALCHSPFCPWLPSSPQGSGNRAGGKWARQGTSGPCPKTLGVWDLQTY